MLPTPIEMLRTSATDMDDEAAGLDEANERALRKIEKRTQQANQFRALAIACREAADALEAGAIVTSESLRLTRTSRMRPIETGDVLPAAFDPRDAR